MRTSAAVTSRASQFVPRHVMGLDTAVSKDSEHKTRTDPSGSYGSHAKAADTIVREFS